MTSAPPRSAAARRVKRPLRSLREEVYDRLRALVNRGRLRPGKYLDLNALAREIGISRTPLRDALLRLECEGFVEIHNRRGVRVAPLSLDRIRHIYEILGALESTTLRSVATRVTAETVARMRQLNCEMVRALDASDFARFYDTNLAFHDTYLNLSDNAELVRQVHLLKQRLYDFPRLKGFVPEWERASVEEHEAMVRCLEQGNVGAAADLLRDVHWSFSYQEPFVRRYYAAQSGDAAEKDGRPDVGSV
ncbi:MAG: GntR family transcriptional regulator [Gemmatimonadetes bacterium]|nr:MAG: GntR family transcriptional regulator [Gemmatimonadota bacterium]